MLNPFDALLDTTGRDPAAIEAAYSLHRSARATQQRAALLDPSFAGVALDTTLRSLAVEEGFKDVRGGIVLAAKPPRRIRRLVAQVHAKLDGVMSGQWLAPATFLHLTLLEITHSTPLPTIAARLASPHLQSTVSQLTQLPSDLYCDLYRPQINVDATALSLSFLPRALDSAPSTYHHLRRALFEFYATTGTEPSLNARYVHPSAHITLGRFVVPMDARDVELLVDAVADVNAWLAQLDDKETNWCVGREGIVEVRAGEVWYGGGDVVARTTLGD